MNSVERIEAALRHKMPDRVPVIAPLGLDFLKKRLGSRSLFDRIVQDPIATLVRLQAELGLDPVIWSYSEFHGEVMDWPASLFRWPVDALANWQTEDELVAKGPGYRDIRHHIVTPKGRLSTRYRCQSSSKWILEHPLKEEKDLEAWAYRPDPLEMNMDPFVQMVSRIAQRATCMHVISGVWNEACDLRGMQQICYDVFDRPEWVKRLLEMLKQRQLRQLNALAKAAIPCVVIDETYVGMGISAKIFREYILPHDRELVLAAQKEGLLVVFHNCGKSMNLLEAMADTGANALQTLTPASSGGDVDLAQAKAMIGDRLCLCGGFDERVLMDGNAEQVRTEARRCLDAASVDGGFILRTAGQVLDAPRENFAALVDEASVYGV